MNCHQCGNTLPPNATACPRCDRPHAKTKVLSESDVNKTRALVQLERCSNCGFMVFPADTECASCGAWIDRDWEKPAAKKTVSRPQINKRAILGAALGIALFAVFWFAITYLMGPR